MTNTQVVGGYSSFMANISCKAQARYPAEPKYKPAPRQYHLRHRKLPVVILLFKRCQGGKRFRRFHVEGVYLNYDSFEPCYTCANDLPMV